MKKWIPSTGRVSMNDKIDKDIANCIEGHAEDKAE